VAVTAAVASTVVARAAAAVRVREAMRVPSQEDQGL
jgi:hypothetical protein